MKEKTKRANVLQIDQMNYFTSRYEFDVTRSVTPYINSYFKTFNVLWKQLILNLE